MSNIASDIEDLRKEWQDALCYLLETIDEEVLH